jgi:DNA-directed RNA polymerase II subunit RPB1
MIAHTRLADVVQNMEICFDPHDESTNVSEDARLLERFYEFERQMVPDNLDNEQVTKSKWIIRLEMDREKMLDKNITMDDVHFAIKNSYTSNDIHCIFADFNMDKLVIRLRVNNSVFRKNTKRGAKSLDKTDDLYMLKDFQDNLLNNIILRGITGIENVFPRKLTNVVSKINGKYVEKKDVWILDTVGTNLLDTLALDYIDPYNTFSNDIKEVFDVLGIEAARQTIYNEFNDVMSFSGVYINHHHLSLLCDRMTCNKCLVAVFRSGILKDNIGPLAKATFEVHAEVLLDAARHAQFDPMRGVSANVMCGQYGYYGTNSFQLLLDLEKFKETKQFKSSNRTMDIETALEMQDEGACSMDRIRITSDIHNVASVVPMSADNYNIGF